MPPPRPRRIVTRAVLALAGVVLLVSVWLVVREPPEIERSRAITLGMTRSEVEAAMGHPDSMVPLEISDGRVILQYGDGAYIRYRLTFALAAWRDNVAILDEEWWPVRVWLDVDGIVERIERGAEVEEAPKCRIPRANFRVVTRRSQLPYPLPQPLAPAPAAPTKCRYFWTSRRGGFNVRLTCETRGVDPAIRRRTTAGGVQ